MYRLMVVLMLAGTTARAQEWSYEKVDSLTYVQFITGHYSALQATGREAIDRQIDFYYLRIRLGISYYERHRYEKALVHFEKAYEMNPADTVLQEYLYYATLFSGRLQEARVLAEKLPGALKTKTGYRPNGIDLVSLETGTSFTDNISTHNDPATNTDLNEQGLYVYHGPVTYGKLFVQHNAGARLQVQHALSVFRSSSMAISKEPGTYLTQHYGNTHFQYNLGLNRLLKNNWKFSAGAGYYHIQFTSVLHGFDNIKRLPFLLRETSPGHYVSATAGLAKRFRYIEPFVTAGYTNMDGLTHLQAGAGLAIYPLGHAGFFLLIQAEYITGTTTNPYVLTQKAGLRINRWLGAGASVLYGHLDNYLAANGFLAYNSFDPLTMAAGADLQLTIGKTQLVPAYRYQLKQATPLLQNSSKSYQYNNHFLILTALWNF